MEVGGFRFVMWLEPRTENRPAFPEISGWGWR